MRKLGCTLFFIGIAFLMLIGCAGTIVDVGANPDEISSGNTSSITATVTQQPAGAPAYSPAPAAPVNFTPTPAVAPPSVGSNVQGEAATTFTGPVVDHDTWYTITARYGNTTGRTRVLVKPPVVTAPFGSSTIAGDDVTVTPSITETSPGVWKFVYTVEKGGVAFSIKSISVSFQKPVELGSDTGTATPSSGEHRNFIVTAPAQSGGIDGAVIITVTGDVEPGGTADWDIIDTAIAHARLSTTGPK